MRRQFARKTSIGDLFGYELFRLRIELRKEFAQRQFESVLSGCRTVAGARAATEFGEHRLDMVAECDVSQGDRWHC